MALFKFVQTWTPVPGKKQEYAAFIAGEFQPVMKALELEIDSEWYALLGEGAHVRIESLAKSFDLIEKALQDEKLREILGRFMNLVTGYANAVLEPVTWGIRQPEEISASHRVKFIQTWDVLSGQQEAYADFLRDSYLPQMGAIGLAVTGGWRVMVGHGPSILCEVPAPDLAALAKGFSDDGYLRLIVMLKELVTNYKSCILVQNRFFLAVIQEIFGRAIRAVPPDKMHSMVGPLGE